MPDKPELPTRQERSESKPRRKDTVDIAMEREEALIVAAAQFKALGDPTRLRIINFLSDLQQVGSQGEAEEADAGQTVGDVSVGIFGKTKVSSTLSHHLKELRNAGLIAMKRRGKNLICRIQSDAIDTLRCYLPGPVLVSVTTKANAATPKSVISTRKSVIAKPNTGLNGSKIAKPNDGLNGSKSPARTRVRKSTATSKTKVLGEETQIEKADHIDNTP